MTLLAVIVLIPLPNCFFRLCLPIFVRCCADIPSTTNNLCNLWLSKLQQVSTQAFLNWDKLYTQKLSCGSPEKLCKCTESLSTLLTETFIELKPLCLEAAVLYRLSRQKKNCTLSYTLQQAEWYRRMKRGFIHRLWFSSQVNVNIMKRIFERWFELQVATYLIVHVLSSGQNVPGFLLQNKGNATQEWNFFFTNRILLNQLWVCHSRVHADNVSRKILFLRFSSSPHHSKFIANKTSEEVSQISSTNFKTTFFVCKVYLKFLNSSRHLNYDTASPRIVPFMIESVHDANNIRDRRV